MIKDYFDLKGRHFPKRITLDPLIKILVIVLHQDIQILVFALVCQIGSQNPTDEVILEYLYDL